ncbi:YjdF family protein [Christensenellaceae bacterium OttesenSCG-928-K19]|nr:YjdF family protein [Christensenellaceae bacterium OttesenSCG-928-K19]
MQTITAKLTVFFDDPFWVGVYELSAHGRLRVCKITFGAEPKDYEVYAFLLENRHRLCFSPPVRIKAAPPARVNPKRMQRRAAREIAKGTGTKSQQALAMQHEEQKAERKTKKQRQNEQEKERQFALKQQKRKQKHKGH